MGKKGRPSRAAALERAWQTIRAASATGGDAFDIKVALQSIAADTSNPPTARVSALKELRSILISEENRREWEKAGT